MNQSTVIIVSDDPEFSGAISSRWQMERNAPSFTLMSGDLCQGLASDTFDLAVVGRVRLELLHGLLKILEHIHKPVIWIAPDAEAAREYQLQPRLILLSQNDAWLESLLLVGTEVLRRYDATARLRNLEQANAILERQAALGRYIIDMRHNLNNALTSVLGNAELLMLENQSLAPQSQAQLETIRNMTLRMHEILQRFSSLEKEMSVAARQGEADVKSRAQAAAAW